MNFCRFLLSSIVTGYPEPILIGWGGHGEWDGAKSHLFKISETLAYLNSLPPSQDDDLALLLDAYDIWLLHRPSVMISRYYTMKKRSNDRLRAEGLLGREHRGAKIENTLFWGADKTCWPWDNGRAACWSVPESTMDPKAFGPDTDTWMVPNRPKWLNSGTLMGPVKDMRAMFNATLEMVHRTFDESYANRNSDQYYFSDLWGEQEIERVRLRDGVVKPPMISIDTNGRPKAGRMPDIPRDRRTEFHISLDYEVDMFQTAAGYHEYLTWMSFNHTTPMDQSVSRHRRRLDELQLPTDIATSRPPFKVPGPPDGLPVEKGWQDVLLGVNTAGLTVYPLYHMTGDKSYRNKWWPNTWFHPWARQLLAANSVLGKDKDAEVIAKLDGVSWYGADMRRNASMVPMRGGSWTDQGEHMAWNDMCVKFESDLFDK